MAEPARQIVAAAATVTVRSQRFGALAVPLDRVITFTHGLIGLPAGQRYALLEPPHAESPFRHLVCLDQPELGFVVCDPEEFWPGYRQHVPRPEAAQGELAVLTIVTVPADPRDMSTNLLAPLVIDAERLCGWQLILEGATYETQHRLLPKRPPAA
jgi:flagellar assembly factor FliW